MAKESFYGVLMSVKMIKKNFFFVSVELTMQDIFTGKELTVTANKQHFKYRFTKNDNTQFLELPNFLELFDQEIELHDEFEVEYTTYRGKFKTFYNLRGVVKED